MIFDAISHLPQCLPPDVWRDLGAFLSRISADVPEGKWSIREQEIFAQISAYKTKPLSEGRFETHECYVDVQFLLSGREMINVMPRDALIPNTSYDAQGDIRFYEAADEPIVRLTMVPGSFAMFFPQDAHCPQLTPQTGVQDVKKVVIKIDVNLL